MYWRWRHNVEVIHNYNIVHVIGTYVDNNSKRNAQSYNNGLYVRRKVPANSIISLDIAYVCKYLPDYGHDLGINIIRSYICYHQLVNLNT